MCHIWNWPIVIKVTHAGFKHIIVVLSLMLSGNVTFVPTTEDCSLYALSWHILCILSLSHFSPSFLFSCLFSLSFLSLICSLYTFHSLLSTATSPKVRVRNLLRLTRLCSFGELDFSTPTYLILFSTIVGSSSTTKMVIVHTFICSHCTITYNSDKNQEQSNP